MVAWDELAQRPYARIATPSCPRAHVAASPEVIGNANEGVAIGSVRRNHRRDPQPPQSQSEGRSQLGRMGFLIARNRRKKRSSGLGGMTWFLGWLLLLSGWLGCSPAAPTQQAERRERPDGKPEVYVDNYPLAYFAERIGGDLIRVVFPAPADTDPAYWKPDDSTLTGYQQADLILINGADYAKWQHGISLPAARVVNTSMAFRKEYIELPDLIVHRHGPGGEHSHHGIAFTTWLDPKLALRQAQAVHEALQRLLPAHQSLLQANWTALQRDLQELDQLLEESNRQYAGQPLLASHPVYQYLARRCGWKLRSEHWEPEELPDEKQWEALGKYLETQPAKWMIWEAEPQEAIQARLATLGVRCLTLPPCGNRPAEGDYLQTMRASLERLQQLSAPSSGATAES